jgi:multiple sugar transport system ATP-binding protein
LAEVVLGVRPETLDISPTPTGLTMRVELVEELGADEFVYGSLPEDAANEKHLVVRPRARDIPQIGDSVHLAVSSDRVHIFDPASGVRVGHSAADDRTDRVTSS